MKNAKIFRWDRKNW